MKRAPYNFLPIGLLLLAGCQFQSADAAAAAEVEKNACQIDADCGAEATCMEGLCASDNADAPLTIAIKVTPLPMADGNDPVSMLLDRFTVDGSMVRDFELPRQIGLGGRLRKRGAVIEAEITFTPVTTIAGIRPSTVTAVTVASQARALDDDFTVQLLDGATYRMLVQPTDAGLAPYQRSVQAKVGEYIDVDYSMIAVRTQTFVIDGVPAGRSVLVSALHPVTGALISSTSSPDAKGEVTLEFGGQCASGEACAPETTAFDLEIRAEQSYEGAGDTPADPSCDTDTPSFPVFRVASQALTMRSDGRAEVTLPPLPERIRYEGTVALCQDAGQAGADLRLPVALRSRVLAFDEPTAVSASFDVTTDALLDPDKLRFCVWVMPGEYDVLVTPPPTIPCALFAEKRLVQSEAPDAVGSELLLPQAAALTGTLRTTDLAPLADATVDAIALGRSSAIALAETDSSLTRYNRSRQTTTDDAGVFALPVDLGSYDVLLKPPAASGFPWQVRYDVHIGARSVEFAATIDMLAPLALRGTLQSASGDDEGQASLADAEIEAFAIIDDADTEDGERAVAIGKAVAGADGQFMLLLPPAMYRGW